MLEIVKHSQTIQCTQLEPLDYFCEYHILLIIAFEAENSRTPHIVFKIHTRNPFKQ